MIETLSPEQARKLVLLSQRLPPGKQTGSAVTATRSAIEHLGYIQIDTISAVQRAHHHTLWNRNPRYAPEQLDQLVAQKHVYEYWSHAAAYLPMRDFRFSLPRKQSNASGAEKHWYLPDKRLMRSVKKRIAAEGPLMAKDFEGTGGKSGGWGSKPAKRALECLYMQGDLMIQSRVNFHKVYDLTERVLPDDIDTTLPDAKEYGRFLVARYLQANGIGRAAEMAYLLKNTKPLVAATLREMVSAGELLEIAVGRDDYYALPAAMALLDKPLARAKLKILSPFDNLLIQRKRMQSLFGFDYLIECYVPEAKRQYGYFSLPILWDGRLVARMDCRAERQNSVLHIHHLAFEPSLKKTEAFSFALQKELPSFLRFNHCTEVRLHKTTPAKFKTAMRSCVKELNQS